ncbi:glucose-6-phosphate isomerase [Scrofimicrobium sp. R131]|uniref:Glucose-6-phosphate isomerase n=1 Tax=Scrofimicrobium appendicitidis TaxID=3079930 RepID=A0AAU7V965_9ACTO
MTNSAPIPAPTDPTRTPAWAHLDQLAEDFYPDLRHWFEADPQRARTWSFTAADLWVDLSKNLIDQEIVAALLELARETGVEEHRDRMFRGDRINVTENRAVLHTALRRPAGDVVEVDGANVVPDVHEVLNRMYDFADRVRSGQVTGISGKKLTSIVNIGIGGSDLGPVMVYEALRPYVDPELSCEFISNIDPNDAGEVVSRLDPETTLVIVTSKTFTTLETLTNARVVREWLLRSLRERGLVTDDANAAEAVERHFVAVSTALDRVAEFGIDPANAFGFWDWVGGRYSVDSAVGLSLAIALGPENFRDLLAGFHAMDQHFQNAPAAENVPLLMGLINVWYTGFLGADTHAVLPYSQYLHRFPAYLQQLTMESNGKSVRWDGSPVSYDTGEVFWGEPGTNGQHAFYQLIHQGTRLVPADFIAFANPTHDFRDGDNDMHELFLSNFFAQTKALAFGKTIDEVRAEGTPETIAPARVFGGNRPTTSIMGDRLNPRALGELIALYEHITFVQGAVWGIDSFDQWGVELGKVLAQQILPAVAGNKEVLAEQDPSTRSLIEYYREHRRH